MYIWREWSVFFLSNWRVHPFPVHFETQVRPALRTYLAKLFTCKGGFPHTHFLVSCQTAILHQDLSLATSFTMRIFPPNCSHHSIQLQADKELQWQQWQGGHCSVGMHLLPSTLGHSEVPFLFTSAQCKRSREHTSLTAPEHTLIYCISRTILVLI